MRTAIAVPALLVLLVATPAAAAGQAIADRVERIRDGDIRVSFAARPGVCGNGEFIGEETPEGFRTHTFGGRGIYSISSYRHVRPVCHEGPVRPGIRCRSASSARRGLNSLPRTRPTWPVLWAWA